MVPHINSVTQQQAHFCHPLEQLNPLRLVGIYQSSCRKPLKRARTSGSQGYIGSISSSFPHSFNYKNRVHHQNMQMDSNQVLLDRTLHVQYFSLSGGVPTCSHAAWCLSLLLPNPVLTRSKSAVQQLITALAHLLLGSQGENCLRKAAFAI